MQEIIVGQLFATMNISIDACCDHEQVVADDDFHEAMVELFGSASGLLFGRTTFELLRGYWPHVAATGSGRSSEVRLAKILDDKPKFVISSKPVSGWNARQAEATPLALRTLKEQAPDMLLLVASPSLARAALEWNLIDQYHVAISPLLAGHGPTFANSLASEQHLSLLDLQQLSLWRHHCPLRT